MTGQPLDLRLAAGAVAAWLAVVGCTGRSAGTILAVAVPALVVAGAVLVGGRGGDRLAATALAGFCIALVLLPFAGRVYRARASPLVALAAQRTAVTLELTLAADPKALAATGAGGAPRVAVPTDADTIVLAGRRRSVDGDVLVLAPATGWATLLPGQRVRVDGVLQPPLDPSELSLTLSARAAPELVGHPPWWQRAAGAIRADLRQASAGLPGSVRGLLPGLVDGDTSTLDPVLAERFKLAGLTHLVAVSGVTV